MFSARLSPSVIRSTSRTQKALLRHAHEEARILVRNSMVCSLQGSGLSSVSAKGQAEQSCSKVTWRSSLEVYYVDERVVSKVISVRNGYCCVMICERKIGGNLCWRLIVMSDSRELKSVFAYVVPGWELLNITLDLDEFIIAFESANDDQILAQYLRGVYSIRQFG
jgi:hypothetical protein